MNEEKKAFIRVEVEGEDKAQWRLLRTKFIEKIYKTLDTVIDNESGSTIKEEAQKFTSALLSYGKEKLKSPSLENEKTIAEIELLYTQKQREIAETRKIHAEADALEFETTIKKLKMAIKGMKALLIGELGQEEIIFIKQIDLFLDTIKEIEGSQGLVAGLDD